MCADGSDADGVKPILGKILKMDFLTDTDFLASSLWPNNPSLHPPILYGLFKDWDGVAPYDPTTVPTRIYADMRTGAGRGLEVPRLARPGRSGRGFSGTAPATECRVESAE